VPARQADAAIGPATVDVRFHAVVQAVLAARNARILDAQAAAVQLAGIGRVLRVSSVVLHDACIVVVRGVAHTTRIRRLHAAPAVAQLQVFSRVFPR
jgi:hypothetical protein